MTMRSVDALECECGHQGTLRTAENDQPYSALWVSHELEGFQGTVDDWNLDGVRCPACKTVGKVRYAHRN